MNNQKEEEKRRKLETPQHQRKTVMQTHKRHDTTRHTNIELNS